MRRLKLLPDMLYSLALLAALFHNTALSGWPVADRVVHLLRSCCSSALDHAKLCKDAIQACHADWLPDDCGVVCSRICQLNNVGGWNHPAIATTDHAKWRSWIRLRKHLSHLSHSHHYRNGWHHVRLAQRCGFLPDTV